MPLPLPTPKQCAGLALLASLVLSGVACWLSPLNQDEGWYLLSARRTAAGAVPYEDYAFTQGPVFPYIYSLAQPWVTRWGVAGGRLFTLLLGWISIGVTAWTAFRIRRREDPWFSVCLVLMLLGLNTFHAQYLATVKTYALTGAFLAAGLGCYLLGIRHRNLPPLILSGLFLALATGTRISMGLFFPALALPLLLDQKRRGHLPWLMFTACSLVSLLLLFLPFFLRAPEGMLFGLVEYHRGRQAEGGLIYKAAFLSQFCLAYLPCALLALPVVGGKWPRIPGLLGVFGGFCAVTLLHLLAPFPYEDYQVALMPALALYLAVQGGEVIVAPRDRVRTARLLLLFGMLFALSSPQWRSWFSSGRDRIWWNVRPEAPLVQLEQAATKLQALQPDATDLLTCDAYLAIQAGLYVPVELNMGPFSYFPEMETDRARHLKVLNAESLQELLNDDPPELAALSGYAFSIQSPEILPLPTTEHEQIHQWIEAVYEEKDVIPSFGQAMTDLILLQRRD